MEQCYSELDTINREIRVESRTILLSLRCFAALLKFVFAILENHTVPKIK